MNFYEWLSFNNQFVLIATFLVLLRLFNFLFHFHEAQKNLSTQKLILFTVSLAIGSLSLFAAILSDNFFGFILWLEIYSICFFVACLLSKDHRFLMIIGKYFQLSATSTLMIFLVFILFFISMLRYDFQGLQLYFENAKEFSNFSSLLIIFTILAIILRFFPYWLYFSKISTRNPINSYALSELFFIHSTIGIFLTIRFSELIKGNFIIWGFDLTLILFFTALAIIAFAIIRLNQQRHLQFIAFYSSLANLGFIIALIAMKFDQWQLIATHYLLTLSLFGLILFSLANLMKNQYFTSSLNKIYLIKKDAPMVLIFGSLLPIFLCFPFTISFIANWRISLMTFNFSFEAIIFIAVLYLMITQANLVFKYLSLFRNNNSTQPVLLDRYFSKFVLLLLIFVFYLAPFFFVYK